MLAGLIGTGAGILLAGLAWIINKHLEKIRSGGKAGATARLWLQRGCVFLMFLGAVIITATGLGSLLRTGAGALSGLGTIAEVIFTLLFVFVLGYVIVETINRPDSKTLTMAFVLPFLATLPLIGIFGTIATSLLTFGASAAASVSAFIGI